MSKLSKSLIELDDMADELLKSCTCKVKKSDDADDDLKPEDVSENVPDDEIKETDEAQEADDDVYEDEGEVKKSDGTDTLDADGINKCNGGDTSKIAKSDDEQQDDEDEDEDEEIERDELAKSFQSGFERNPEIQKSIDASEFLSAVTEILSKSMADICYDLKASTSHSNDSSNILAKSLQASLQLNKAMSEEIQLLKEQNAELKGSIQKSFADFQAFMEEKFDDFSHQPTTMRKSLASVNVHDRNFAKSLDTGVGTQLSKSEVLAKMSNLLMHGSPVITSSDIIAYESGAPMRPEVSQLIYNG